MVEPARPEEMAAAFRLIFQHVRSDEREARVANALELVKERALEPDGVLVVRDKPGLVGAIVCMALPAAGGLVWPPHVKAHADRSLLEDQLVHRACSWLRQRGAKLAQTLLAPHEIVLAQPLERNGFKHVTNLRYMRHSLELSAPLLCLPEVLSYQNYASCAPDLFHQTLLRTYDDTQDCPEVNGVRTIEEIIAGHQSQGVHHPEQWWLAFDGDSPVAVLLLTEMPEWDGWDLVYLGVVPSARGRGFGRELTRKAILEARAAEGSQLTLSVDARNLPAWNLYQSLGFEAYDQREVFLAIW